MGVLPVIAVTNESKSVSDAEIEAAISDLHHQAMYDFRPFWNAGCSLVYIDLKAGEVVPKAAWHLAILETSDQAGALGYHDVTASNQPLLKVFAGDDKKYGLSWSVTASHEILETLADPWISACWQTDASTFYAIEVCDPVEDDSLGYKGPHGTLLSDFVLPGWYVPGLQVPRYSFKGSVAKPLQLAVGGYASLYKVGKGWTQLYAEAAGKTRTVGHSALRTPVSRSRAQRRAEVGAPITAGPVDYEPPQT